MSTLKDSLPVDFPSGVLSVELGADAECGASFGSVAVSGVPVFRASNMLGSAGYYIPEVVVGALVAICHRGEFKYAGIVTDVFESGGDCIVQFHAWGLESAVRCAPQFTVSATGNKHAVLQNSCISELDSEFNVRRVSYLTGRKALELSDAIYSVAPVEIRNVYWDAPVQMPVRKVNDMSRYIHAGNELLSRLG